MSKLAIGKYSVLRLAAASIATFGLSELAFRGGVWNKLPTTHRVLPESNYWDEGCCVVEVVASYGTMWLSPRRALALAPSENEKRSKN